MHESQLKSAHSRQSSSDSSLLHNIEEQLSITKPPASPLTPCHGHEAELSRRKVRTLAILCATSVGSSICLSLIASGSGRPAVPYLAPVTFLALTLATRLILAFLTSRGMRYDAVGSAQHFGHDVCQNAARGLIGALSLSLQVVAIDHAGIGLLQALEAITPVIIIGVSRPLSFDSLPGVRLTLAAHLVCFTVLLSLISQSTSTLAATLSILSALCQALYLGMTKRALASSTSSSPMSVLCQSVPYSFFFSMLFAYFIPFQNTLTDDHTKLFEMSVIGDTVFILPGIFCALRCLELLGEIMAVHTLQVPTTAVLLHAPRNAATLVIATILGLFTGLQTHLQMWAVHVANCFIVAWLEPEIQTNLFYSSGQSTPTLIGHEPSQSFGYKQEHSLPLPPVFNESSALLRFTSFINPILLFLWLLTTSALQFRPSGVAVLHRNPTTFDMVFSYYNESLDAFIDTIDNIKTVPSISKMEPRIIVYVKHSSIDLHDFMSKTGADEVVRLDNYGREGGTYLSHIMRHYNASNVVATTSDSFLKTISSRSDLGLERISRSNVFGFADYTLFMQPHLAWHWIGQSRLEMFDSERTGFISLGPWLTSDCGEDGAGNGKYDRLKDIYEIFQESFCPPSLQLATYAGQFIVSRKRILDNPYSKYANLRDLLQAPSDHWLHEEGDWFGWQGTSDQKKQRPQSPQSPFLGHALERSWPTIFNCIEPAIAEQCSDDKRDAVNDQWICQCQD